MIIYDISLPLTDELAVWPGDVPFTLSRTLSINQGDAVNLGSMQMSLHAGTHLDAPLHIDSAGAGSEAFDLSICMGPALVIDVSGRSEVTTADLGPVRSERPARLLLKTGAWPDPSIFPLDVPAIASDVPGFLHECGVKLLGVDFPSVDSLESKELPIHRALVSSGITILESLCLAAVPPGEYELIALPLKIVGADGAPARAVLKGITAL